MTALRQRMIEDMQLKGLAARTQEAYVLAVRQLAEYHGKAPDRMSEEDLRAYFLYLMNVKKVARSTSTLALCGIKFFYEKTLGKQWPVLELVRPAKESKLPVVLSIGEVGQILRGSEEQPLPGVFDADLFMWVTLAGGGANASEADRWGAETGTRERGKRKQRPLCANTGDHLGNDAGILAAIIATGCGYFQPEGVVCE